MQPFFESNVDGHGTTTVVGLLPASGKPLIYFLHFFILFVLFALFTKKVEKE